MIPVGEILLRSLVCCSVVGVVGYLVGMAHHAGRRQSATRVRVTGAAAGLVGGLALVAGFGPWQLAVVVSLLMAVFVAVLFNVFLGLQDEFSAYVEKRRRKE
jgi:hypothetical protein